MAGTKSLLLVVTLTLASIPTISRPVAAEWMADLYLGATYTPRSNIKVDTSVAGTSVDTISDNGIFVDRATNKRATKIDSAPSFGVRFGYWFQDVPYLGLGLDGSYSRPNIRSQTFQHSTSFTDSAGDTVTVILPVRLQDADLSVVTISFDLLLRWPLFKSPEFPTGRLQPYVTAGPALFVATATAGGASFFPQVTADSAGDGTLVQSVNRTSQSVTDTSWGPKVGGGLAWQLRKDVALFAEYRFMHFSPTFELHDVGGKTTLKTDLDIHAVLAGISFRF
jgi:opacity protein-like surface antigen